MWDRPAEPNSRDQILKREQGQGKFRFPFLADHKQDWQPHPVDAQSAERDDHTHTHTHIHIGDRRMVMRTVGSNREGWQ